MTIEFQALLNAGARIYHNNNPTTVRAIINESAFVQLPANLSEDDWRASVPKDVRDQWADLTLETRAAVYLTAKTASTRTRTP